MMIRFNDKKLNFHLKLNTTKILIAENINPYASGGLFDHYKMMQNPEK